MVEETTGQGNTQASVYAVRIGGTYRYSEKRAYQPQVYHNARQLFNAERRYFTSVTRRTSLLWLLSGSTINRATQAR